ncbi:unnamed protein product [Closterium sp. NIES-53]
MRDEMGAMKMELARMRAAAERQVAEVAYVKASAVNLEVRINDVELALASLKDGCAEKRRADRKAGCAGEHAEVERHERKRRKREETGNMGWVENAAAGGGHVLVAKDRVEKDGEAKGRKNDEACDIKAGLKAMRVREVA